MGERGVRGMTYLIEQATLNHAHGIAQVRVKGWQETYRGIVPDAYLDALSIDDYAAAWRARLKDPLSDRGLYVASFAGGVVGFAQSAKSRDPHLGIPGEFWAIYLLKEAYGRGIGRDLMRACARWLLARGIDAAHLWVMRDNARARAFYERLGGLRLDADNVFDIAGAAIPEVAYAWHDLTPLAAG